MGNIDFPAMLGAHRPRKEELFAWCRSKSCLLGGLMIVGVVVEVIAEEEHLLIAFIFFKSGWCHVVGSLRWSCRKRTDSLLILDGSRS